MKRNRVICMLLCLAMVITLFAGCKATGTEETQTTDKEATGTTTEKASYAPNDPRGKSWFVPFEKTVTLTGMVAWTPDPGHKEGTNPETNAYLTMLKDLLNIEIKILWQGPEEMFKERFQLSVSAGDIPDLLKLDTAQFYEFLENGMLMDITEGYQKYASDVIKESMVKFNKDTLNYCSKDGKLYSIPAVLDTRESMPTLAYRKDWLDALGMKVPASIEEINDMIIAFGKYDTTYRGKEDTIGLGTTSSIFDGSFGLRGYFHYYGAYPDSWIMKNGKLVNGTIQDEMKAPLDALRKLYASGGMRTDFATVNSDMFGQDVTNDLVGACFGNYWIEAWPLNLNKEANPKAEWERIAPVGPGGKEAKTRISQSPIQHFNCVSSKAPKEAADAIAKILSLHMSRNGWSKDDKTIYEKYETQYSAADFFLPVYLYYPTPWEDLIVDVPNAYKTGDTSKIVSEGAKQFYNAYKDWMDNGINSKNLRESWGTYKSRLDPNSGICLNIKLHKEGKYEMNYFYGPATPKEREVASTLRSMSIDFIIAYIMGKKTDADWEAFKSDWLKLGGEQWIKEVNDQYTKLFGK